MALLQMSANISEDQPPIAKKPRLDSCESFIDIKKEIQEVDSDTRQSLELQTTKSGDNEESEFDDRSNYSEDDSLKSVRISLQLTLVIQI